jgi:hypothetical protein
MRIERRQFLRLERQQPPCRERRGLAHAQAYPTRNITLVVPFPAGGGVASFISAIARHRLSYGLGSLSRAPVQAQRATS